MVRFPSPEWAEAFRTALNASPEYAEAARLWEGDVLLLVRADEAAPHGAGVHLDLFHGECRSAKYVDDPRTVTSEFVFEGARADWGRMLRRELDPVQALLRGTFKIRGNLAKVMRFTRAATLLASTAASIPAEM